MKLRKWRYTWRVKCSDGKYRTGVLKNCGFHIKTKNVLRP